jgi:predicted RND superfamily exporter protein
LTDRILDALARLCLRHSKLIAIAALVVFVGALLAARRISFDPDRLNLLPQKSQQLLEDKGANDTHVVVIHMPEGQDVRNYNGLVEEVANGYSKSARVQTVDYRRPTASGYLLSADREMLLILVRPKRAAQDIPFTKALLTEASIIDTRALSNFQKSVPAGTPLPSIEHAGAYRIAATDADLIRRDIVVTVITTFAGVLVIFLYGFRRSAPMFYATAPMAIALSATFAVAALAYGRLSSASAGFAALLAGLGINFITILYARYVDERNRGVAMPEGLIVAMRTSLPGIFVAALATATTFYALVATDVRGMTQLGILTGTGVLIFLLCVALVVPALLVRSERGGSKRAPKTYLHSFGTSNLMASSIGRPRVVIAVWIVLLAACALLATRVRFDDNIQDLRAKDNEGIFNQDKVTRKFGQPFGSVSYVVEGAPRAELAGAVRADAIRSTLIGFSAVLLLMIISFRNAKMVFLSVVPFIAGALSMLGLMGLFNLELNFMSIFVALMIMGCSIASAVYMLQRYREDPAVFARTAHVTGKAVVMAMLATIVGYGSLALSHYPGLRSIGYASLLGVAFSGLAAITLLPAILVSGKGERGRGNDEQLSQHPAVSQ